MKKLISLTATMLIVILLSLLLISCDNSPIENDKPSVVATNFPAYDFARQICGDKINIIKLLPNGAESHTYDPSPKDIIEIQQCSLFIYTGGVSDVWVDKMLDSCDKKINTVKMINCVNALNEEVVEGMQTEEDGDEYDEHVWTSVKNAIKICQKIYEQICIIDPDNAEYYQNNFNLYKQSLEKLDSKFENLFKSSDKPLIFADRFPFLYFAKDYNLKYYAAFPGCSSDTEPNAATISFLIDKVKNENISTVFYLEFSTHKVADIIADDTKAKTAILHSCHNVTNEEFDNGETYLSLMEKNYKTLLEAFE